MSEIITDSDPGDETDEVKGEHEIGTDENTVPEYTLEQVLTVFRDTLMDHEFRLINIEGFLNGDANVDAAEVTDEGPTLTLVPNDTETV